MQIANLEEFEGAVALYHSKYGKTPKQEVIEAMREALGTVDGARELLIGQMTYVGVSVRQFRYPSNIRVFCPEDQIKILVDIFKRLKEYNTWDDEHIALLLYADVNIAKEVLSTVDEFTVTLIIKKIGKVNGEFGIIGMLKLYWLCKKTL